MDNKSRDFILEDLSKYKYLNLPKGKNVLELNYDDYFKCELEYDMISSGIHGYALVAYSGTRTLGGGRYTIGVQVCGVLFCRNNSTNSCGKEVLHQDFEKETNFKSLILKGKFKESIIPMPVSLDKYYQPILDTAFNHGLNNEFTHEITSQTKNIIFYRTLRKKLRT